MYVCKSSDSHSGGQKKRGGGLDKKKKCNIKNIVNEIELNE